MAMRSRNDNYAERGKFANEGSDSSLKLKLSQRGKKLSRNGCGGMPQRCDAKVCRKQKR